MTWARATTDLDCGYCGTRIARGELVALLTPMRLKRCVDCAERCPWPNLPPLPEPQPEPLVSEPSGPGTTERLVSGSLRQRFEAWMAVERRKGAA